KKSQTKNKQASGEKVDKKDAKDKTPPAQKKRDPASKLDKKDTKCHDLGWECALADNSTGSQWFAGKVQSWLVWLQAVSKVLGLTWDVPNLCGELKQLAQKLEEKEKALEEEGRWKEEKKGVSVGNQPIKPEKGKTKAPEKEETKASENKTKLPEKKETESPEGKETKAPEKGATKCSEKWETKAAEMEETEIPEDPAEMENNLILRFQIYESSQQNVAQVFSYWNRIQGTVQLPVIQKGNKSQSSAENKGQKTNKPQEKVEKKPEQKSGDQRSLQSSQLDTQSEVAEGAVREEHVGVPCLDIQVSDPKAMIREILRERKLPTKDEMLKHVGLHPDGPPLPPGGVLSIVEYPEERLGSAERVEPFTIVAPEGAAVEDNL
ncbi:hydrocephalus-inducing protein homolog, partial [Passer montanus]|uniref:hydrocephalus-inducing protein homolog n=1 Tax=Passer montanus TaxID=9160 RepID=UPI00195F64DB